MINVPNQKVGNVWNAKVPSNPKGKQEHVHNVNTHMPSEENDSHSTQRIDYKYLSGKVRDVRDVKVYRDSKL